MLYCRGGQSAAPVSNFGCTPKLFMTHLCMKIETTQNLHQLCDVYARKNKTNFFAARNLNEIWPVRKKVWPPLMYCFHNKSNFK